MHAPKPFQVSHWFHKNNNMSSATAQEPLGSVLWRLFDTPFSVDRVALWTRIRKLLKRLSPDAHALLDGNKCIDDDKSMYHQQFIALGLYFFVPPFREEIQKGFNPMQRMQMDHLGTAWCCLWQIFCAGGRDRQHAYDKQARFHATQYTKNILYRGVIDFTADMLTILFTGMSARTNMAFHYEYQIESFAIGKLFDKLPVREGQTNHEL